MLIQVRTDNHIPNSEALLNNIRAAVDGTVSRRYADQLPRTLRYIFRT